MRNWRAPISNDEQLTRFAQRARTADSVSALVEALITHTREVVNSDVCSVALRTDAGHEVHQAGIDHELSAPYAALITELATPIHALLDTRRGVLRSNDIFDDEEWRRHPLARALATPFALGAYMAGELGDAQAPRGVISAARERERRQFSIDDAQRLQMLCLHASIALTRLNYEARTPRAARALSAKQRHLVQLVANGLTNVQIAKACNITTHGVKKSLERLFGQHEVGSRTELIAKLGIRRDDHE